MDDYIASGDYSDAVDRALQALHIYDEEREFDHSIQILEKLVEIAEHQNKKMEMSKYVDNIRVRALLSKNTDKFQQMRSKYGDLPTTPITSFLEQMKDKDEGHIIIEGIEIQSIFGEFEPLQNIPYVTYDQHEAAVQLVEDFYGEGRYLVHLLDSQTSLHQAINLDVGNVETVNIVDRNHIFRVT